MPDYAALKAADAALPGAPLSLPAAFAALSAQTVTAAPRDITWASVRDVLMNSFEWGSLGQVADAPLLATLPGGGTQTLQLQGDARCIRECCLWGGNFNAANAVAWGRLVAAATRLSAANVGAITQASGAAVGALRTPAAPAWPGLTLNDLWTARGQPVL